MITSSKLLSWLNWERMTNLPVGYQGLTRVIHEPRIPTEIRAQKARKLLTFSNRMQPLEKAEALADLGCYCLEHDQFEDAKKHLIASRQIFTLYKDTHRQGITEWLLHLANHSQGDYMQAFSWANQARSLFSEIAQIRAKHFERAKEQWYRDRILEITCDLALGPHYVYEWLIEPRGSCLSEPALLIRNTIRELLKKGDYQEIVCQLDLLLGISRDSSSNGKGIKETAEALVFTGLVQSSLGNLQNAIAFYRSAVSKYSPGSHEQVHARWMLGLSQLKDPELQYKGINNLEICLEEMEKLKVTADRQNREADRQRYVGQQEAMGRALKQAMQPNNLLVTS